MLPLSPPLHGRKKVKRHSSTLSSFSKHVSVLLGQRRCGAGVGAELRSAALLANADSALPSCCASSPPPSSSSSSSSSFLPSCALQCARRDGTILHFTIFVTSHDCKKERAALFSASTVSNGGSGPMVQNSSEWWKRKPHFVHWLAQEIVFWWENGVACASSCAHRCA